MENAAIQRLASVLPLAFFFSISSLLAPGRHFNIIELCKVSDIVTHYQPHLRRCEIPKYHESKPSAGRTK
jgi:hypothetical protein